MPSGYAHYRFGVSMLSQLPRDVGKSVQRFRRLYDVGLYGPDMFFYANPLLSNKVGELGNKFHEQTGKEFFGRVCRMLRLESTEGARAYLYGVLCHYCLDSRCHPYIWDITHKGLAGHSELETDFDRYLLELDGKTPPHAFDLSGTVRLTEGECATVARFYPGASEADIRRCVKNMAFVVHLLASPDGWKRKGLEMGFSSVLKSLRSFLMEDAPNPRCMALIPELMEHYHRAEADFPELVRQIRAHMTSNTPLGEEFSGNFG